MSEPEYFTAETHKIIVTLSYYDEKGDLVPNKYHLEDGRELVQDDSIYCTNMDDYKHMQVRFVLKGAEVK